MIDLAEPPESEAGIVLRGADMIEARLPSDWQWELDADAPVSDRRVDGLATISDSNAQVGTLIIEAKQIIEGRDVANLKSQLDSTTSLFTNAVPVVMARFLSMPVQAKLKTAGLSYVDMTGNIYLRTTTPGLFISDRGADSDPWRGPGRPRGTLKGAPAAKIVRALADFTGIWTVRELVDKAETSTGSTYRVIDFLEREGLAIREETGKISVTDWPAMLRRWSNDYTFADTNQVTRWIAPRGLDQLTQVIADNNADDEYVVTGSLAAAQWAPYAPARMAMIYASNPDDAAEKWDLRAADAGANVILGQPRFDTVFVRSAPNEAGVVIAAASQVVVDLMTGPGRNPSESEELLTWMQGNEGTWRRER
jgi:hypothetical protein